MCIFTLYIQKWLHIFMGCAILTKAKRRRSILVRSAVSEGGPKKPPKGIPVKLLVFA